MSFYWYSDQGANPNCTEGSLRLLRNQASTPFKSYGRVEICHSNHWGSICDSGWGTPDAKVACGQLGYTASGDYIMRYSLLQLLLYSSIHIDVLMLCKKFEPIPTSIFQVTAIF